MSSRRLKTRASRPYACWRAGPVLDTWWGDFTGDGVQDLLATTLVLEDDALRGDRTLLVWDPDLQQVIGRETGLYSAVNTGFPVALDVNGDGIQDLIGREDLDYGAYATGGSTSPQRRHVYLSTGTEFIEIEDPVAGQEDWLSQWSSTLFVQDAWGFLYDVQPDVGFDINGDARGDLLVRAIPWEDRIASRDGTGPFSPDDYYYENLRLWVFQSNGDRLAPADTGRVLQGPWGPLITVCGDWCYLLYPLRHFIREQTLVLDANGDGALDVFEYGDHAEHGLAVPGLYNILLNKNPAVERVEAITDGLGKRTEIRYAALSDPEVYQRGSGCQHPVRCDTDVRYVVAEVRRDSGLGSSPSPEFDGRIPTRTAERIS